MERTLEDDLTLAALRMALSQRTIQPGLVHHSGRGSQYASQDYTDLLKAQGIDISMSRKANPWDNAACEASGHWWFTNPSVFPYLYDFTRNAWLDYDPSSTAGRYSSNPRYFVNMTTTQVFAM